MGANAQVVDDTQRTAARVAALAYLLSLAAVVYAYFGLRAGLFVSDDMAESLRRIAAAESAFRLSVVLDVVYCIGVVVALTALYIVLRPVHRRLALLAAALRLVDAVTAMLTVLSLLTVVRLANTAAYRQSLSAESLHALVRLNWYTASDQYYVGLAFWSLSSTILGWLWLKSRYIPVPLALVGLVSSAWCALCTFAYIINPAFANAVNLWWFDSPMVLFDIVLCFWLLFRGLRDPAGAAKPAAPLPRMDIP
jgi:hypothetical protein